MLDIEGRLSSYQPLWEQWYKDSCAGAGSAGVVYRLRADTQGILSYCSVRVTPVMFGTSGIPGESRKQAVAAELDRLSMMRDTGHVVRCLDHAIADLPDGNGNAVGFDLLIRTYEYKPLTLRLQENGPLNEAQVRDLALQLAEGLRTIHETGTFHRDIGIGTVYADGDSFLLGFPDISGKDPAAGAALPFAAPEVRSFSQHTAASDIYSLGILLYYLLNGNRLPMVSPGASPADISNAIRSRLSGKPFPPPACSDESLKQVVMKCCAFDPAARYNTAQQIINDLMSSQSGAGSQTFQSNNGTQTSQPIGGGSFFSPIPPVPPVPDSNAVPSYTPPYPGTASYPGTPAYPGTTSYPGTQSYPGTTSYPGTQSYPGTASYPGTPSYPGAGTYPGTGANSGSTGYQQEAQNVIPSQMPDYSQQTAPQKQKKGMDKKTLILISSIAAAVVIAAGVIVFLMLGKDNAVTTDSGSDPVAPAAVTASQTSSRTTTTRKKTEALITAPPETQTTPRTQSTTKKTTTTSKATATTTKRTTTTTRKTTTTTKHTTTEKAKISTLKQPGHLYAGIEEGDIYLYTGNDYTLYYGPDPNDYAQTGIVVGSYMQVQEHGRTSDGSWLLVSVYGSSASGWMRNANLTELTEYPGMSSQTSAFDSLYSGRMVKDAAYRRGPNSIRDQIPGCAVIPKGAYVQIAGRCSGWYYVYYGNYEGWVSSDTVSME